MSDRLMTYAELASELSIKPASAKKLAMRRRWVRAVGNDGLARVRVPLEAFPGDVSGDGPRAVPVVVPPVSPPVDTVSAELIDALKGQVEAERKRADAAEARIKDLEEDRDAWRNQARRSLWSKIFGE